LSDLKRQKL